VTESIVVFQNLVLANIVFETWGGSLYKKVPTDGAKNCSLAGVVMKRREGYVEGRNGYDLTGSCTLLLTMSGGHVHLTA
jgi:hypothetical protein